ncbi:hypothetical protein ACQKLP_13260 [Chitinophaga sp. NPDC101104]|uniref:hypothetical protein n=1 Tax=Chitinophaga sp. NPDC101104 TaxID=3390561 RepID=UPI003D04EF4A
MEKMHSKGSMAGELTVFLFLILMIWYTYDSFQELYIGWNGTLEKAVVTPVPKDYSRRSTIDVAYNSKEYSLPIMRSEFKSGKYAVGDTVNVCALPGYDFVLREDNRHGRKFWMGLGGTLFFLGILVLNQLSSRKRKPPRRRTKAEKRKTRRKKGLRPPPGAHSPKFP